MEVSIVNKLDEDKWREFVAQNPAGNIFHTPEMFHVFQNTKGYKPELWAAVGSDNQILALWLPVGISLKTGMLRPLTTRSIVFGGILVGTGLEAKQALTMLLRTYQKESGRRSLFCEVRNVSSSIEIQPVLRDAQFTYEDHLNYLIDLGPSPEMVFGRIGRRTQRNIRHALNQAKVSIKEVNTHNGLDETYDLLCKTYSLAQVPLADKSLFYAAFDILAPKGMLRATTAFVGLDPAATSVELFYKNTIYGWYGGMDRTHSAFVPNEVLMWHILRLGAENGYCTYDFGGAGKPGEKYGVRDFKAKFGGNLVSYGRNRWVPNQPLLSICTLGYEGYRRLLSLGRSSNDG